MAKKNIWKSRAERDAWDAHVDETIRYVREYCLKGINELRDRRGYDVSPDLRALIERSVRLSER